MQLLTVTGNIGRDVEKKEVGGNMLHTFSIGSSRKVKGEDVTTWYQVECWGPFYEKVAEYLSKGTKVLVVGELNVRTYQKDGNDKYALDIRADKVELIGSKPKQEDGSFDYGANKKAKTNPFEE